jgi:hypothetical protein
MRTIFGIVLFCTMTSVLQAQQQPEIPKEVLDGLAKDLEALNELLLGSATPREPSSPVVYGGLPPTVTVTETKAVARQGASIKSEVAWTSTKGETLRVVDRVQEFYAVTRPATSKGNVKAVETGWMLAADVVPLLSPTTAADSYAAIIAFVTKMRDKYKNNRYISIEGFSPTVGVPPSVTINFIFK